MNPSTRRLYFLAAGLWFAAFGLAGAQAAARPAARPPARPSAKPADRYLRTKERIDALLKSRLNPDPLPATLANPFQLPAGMAVVDPRTGPSPDLPAGHKGDPVATTKPVEPAIPTNDTEALALYAADLKITGTVKLNGQAHLIINQSPYKEGDLLLLNRQNDTVYLQIVRITQTELTLGLNQAVLTLKLKY